MCSCESEPPVVGKSCNCGAGMVSKAEAFDTYLPTVEAGMISAVHSSLVEHALSMFLVRKIILVSFAPYPSTSNLATYRPKSRAFLR